MTEPTLAAPPPARLAPRESSLRTFRSYARGLLAPLVIWGLMVVVLVRPIEAWLTGQDTYDQDALREWLDETRGSRDTLPEMIAAYVNSFDSLRKKLPPQTGEI